MLSQKVGDPSFCYRRLDKEYIVNSKLNKTQPKEKMNYCHLRNDGFENIKLRN